MPGPLRTDRLGRPCHMDVKVALLDGAQRDRCPYVGDQAVTGKTLLLADPATYGPALRSSIRWFAAHQHGDGSIPASPYDDGDYVLFDYNAYWIETVYDYVLRTGDVGLARQVWPNLVRLVDQWYRARFGPRGLLVNDLGPRDYAYIKRSGPTVSYYNAGYVRAVRMAIELAGLVGDETRTQAWSERLEAMAQAFRDAFWDADAGAFRDTISAPAVHSQDGNVFAVLAGLATPEEATTALRFVSRTLWRPYGSAMADNDSWDDEPRWGAQASFRVYPFMGYFEVLARYAAGLDDSALTLLRREWGYMVANGPGTMWEMIGPFGGPPVDPAGASWSHGWSSGAAPALSEFVLGVSPASPGFETVDVAPHVGDLRWAEGDVPTPRGTVHVKWTHGPRKMTLTLVTPVRAAVVLPVAGRAVVDEQKVLRAQTGVTRVRIGPGTHTLVVTYAPAAPR